MTDHPPKRGEIWWASLDPTVGSEIRKKRPCLVLSTDIVNEHRRTVLVAPLSSSPKPNPPITVPIECSGKSGVVVVDQMRAISKERLQSFLQKATEKEVEAVIEALKIIIEA